MGEFALVMPMAGRGSRFEDGAEAPPKPLLDLWGRPFFWWAAESARRAFNPVETIFVILKDHVDRFAIRHRIAAVYPNARFAVIDQVTSGAAETARIGVEQLNHSGPVIVNDADHAFVCRSAITAAIANDPQSALLTFPSESPAYSYVRFDGHGAVAGTVEKQVVSSDAIAGAYLFASPQDYLDAYIGYESDRRYSETFVSGLFDRLIAQGRPVSSHRIDAHLSFGTPDELLALGASPAGPWKSWL
jgi:CTP:molybdopterin cytidylyltransferase MocA